MDFVGTAVAADAVADQCLVNDDTETWAKFHIDGDDDGDLWL